MKKKHIRSHTLLKKKAYIKRGNKKLRNISKYKILIGTIIIILCLFIVFKSLRNMKGNENKNEINQIEIFNITQFFNTTIRTNSVFIFEKNNFHYECTPGYTKYFLDLDFNVDIIMTEMGNESFIFLNQQKN